MNVTTWKAEEMAGYNKNVISSKVRIGLGLSMAGSGIGSMEALDSILRQSIKTRDVAVYQNTCLHLPQFPPLPFPSLKWSVHRGLSRPSEPVHRHIHMTY